MTPGLERRYRLLLRAYPASWRARRAAEMLGTLADGARPGQRFPAPREVTGLLVRTGSPLDVALVVGLLLVATMMTRRLARL